MGASTCIFLLTPFLNGPALTTPRRIDVNGSRSSCRTQCVRSSMRGIFLRDPTGWSQRFDHVLNVSSRYSPVICTVERVRHGERLLIQASLITIVPTHVELNRNELPSAEREAAVVIIALSHVVVCAARRLCGRYNSSTKLFTARGREFFQQFTFPPAAAFPALLFLQGTQST